MGIAHSDGLYLQIANAGLGAPLNIKPAFLAYGFNPGVDIYAAVPTNRVALVNELARVVPDAVLRSGEQTLVWSSIGGEAVAGDRVNEYGILNSAGVLLQYGVFEDEEIGPGTRLDFRFQLYGRPPVVAEAAALLTSEEF